MAYASSLSRYIGNVNAHQAKEVADSRQANQQLERKPADTEVPPEIRRPPPGNRDRIVRSSAGDRRHVCQRIMHQPFLVELRAGINRRRRTLRASDVAEHIDVKA